MGLNDYIKIFAEGLGISLVGVCGVFLLFLLIVALGCSLFGGDEGNKEPDKDEDDNDSLFD